MARKKQKKLDLSSAGDLQHNPFAALGKQFGVEAAQEKPETAEPKKIVEDQPVLMVRKEKRKKGKMMTCVYHLKGDRKAMLKKLKHRFGTGGTIEEDVLALQGDLRQQVADWFQAEGYKVRLGN